MIKKIVHDNAKKLTILAPISMKELTVVRNMCNKYHSDVSKEFNMTIDLNIVKETEDELENNTCLSDGTILILDSKSEILNIEKHIKLFIVSALIAAINKYERK